MIEHVFFSYTIWSRYSHLWTIIYDKNHSRLCRQSIEWILRDCVYKTSPNHVSQSPWTHDAWQVYFCTWFMISIRLCSCQGVLLMHAHDKTMQDTCHSSTVGATATVPWIPRHDSPPTTPPLHRHQTSTMSMIPNSTSFFVIVVHFILRLPEAPHQRTALTSWHAPKPQSSLGASLRFI